jgi:hypothetical protein
MLMTYHDWHLIQAEAIVMQRFGSSLGSELEASGERFNAAEVVTMWGDIFDALRYVPSLMCER